MAVVPHLIPRATRSAAPWLLALTLVAAATFAGGASAFAAGGGSGALVDAARALGLVPMTGTPPAFALAVLDGQVTRLADLRGRPALLYFWATW